MSRSLINLIKSSAPPVEEVPIEVSFLEEFLRTIDAESKLNHREPSKSYKPSSLTCMRNMYFQVTGTPGAYRGNPFLTGMAESGTDRHERLQKYTMKMVDYGSEWKWVDIEQYIKDHNLTDLVVVSRQGNEVKLYNKALNMSFLCDGMLYSEKRNIYVIVEYKTESTYKFMQRTGIAPDHIIQGTSYCTCFDLNKVLFVYENRDNCAKKTFLLHVTPEDKISRVVSRIAECDGYVLKNIPPPKPLDISTKTCQYCNYVTECKKAGI